MKILLDECVTKHLKPYLDQHEVFTVTEMKWNGYKNGILMSVCTEHQFDILLTIDKNLQHQQNLDKYTVIIVVLNCFTSKLEELIEFIPSFKAHLLSFQRHKVFIIENNF